MSSQTGTITIAPPLPPPTVYYYYYDFHYYFSVPAPALVAYPSPQHIYQFHYPLLLPFTHAATTTTDNNPSHDSVGMLNGVTNKKRFGKRAVAAAAPRHCKNMQEFSPRRRNPTWVWRPKTTEFTIKNETTVMIKNIPNALSQKMLLAFLDKHCSVENQKNQNKDVPSEFDFVYLPVDFRSGLNLGYGFVNFTNAVAATRFYNCCQNKKWEGFHSEKICDIKIARIQGKEELVNNFARSYFFCHTDEYLPVVFTPPRNGANSTSPTCVGRRWSEK